MALAPLGCYAPLACKLHNSLICADTQNFENERKQGCASLGGNCRRVFCDRCVQMGLNQTQMDKERIITAGMECLIPEMLVHYNEKERQVLYDIGARAYEYIQNEKAAPLSTEQLKTVRATLGFFIEDRTEKLKAIRAGSTSYALKHSVYQIAESIIKGQLIQANNFVQRQKKRAYKMAGDAQNIVNDRLDQAQQYGQKKSDQAKGYAQRGTQRIQDFTQTVSQKADDLSANVDQLENKIKRINQHIKKTGQDLNQAQRQGNRTLTRELEKQLKAQKIQLQEVKNAYDDATGWEDIP